MKQEKVNKTYSELRKIANKRAMRMERAGMDTEFAGVYFPKISSLDEEGVRAALASVSRFLRDPRSLIKGYRKQESLMLKSLQESGYDFVNETNLKKFGEFMEWARARMGANDRVFGSDRVAELFEQVERLKISNAALKKNFEHYMENIDVIPDVEPLERTSRHMSDRELSSRIRKAKK